MTLRRFGMRARPSADMRCCVRLWSHSPTRKSCAPRASRSRLFSQLGWASRIRSISASIHRVGVSTIDRVRSLACSTGARTARAWTRSGNDSSITSVAGACLCRRHSSRANLPCLLQRLGTDLVVLRRLVGGRRGNVDRGTDALLVRLPDRFCAALCRGSCR